MTPKFKILRQTAQNAIARCHNPNTPNYKDYGGRGIKVAKLWRENSLVFATWLKNNLGYRPKGCQLDRIDNSKGYTPSNLRWSTTKDNLNNRRNTRFIDYKNEKLPISDVWDLLEKSNLIKGSNVTFSTFNDRTRQKSKVHYTIETAYTNDHLTIKNPELREYWLTNKTEKSVTYGCFVIRVTKQNMDKEKALNAPNLNKDQKSNLRKWYDVNKKSDSVSYAGFKVRIDKGEDKKYALRSSDSSQRKFKFEGNLVSGRAFHKNMVKKYPNRNFRSYTGFLRDIKLGASVKEALYK